MSERPPSDASAEDWVEQRKPADPAEQTDDNRADNLADNLADNRADNRADNLGGQLSDATTEANEADVLEQAIDVPLDDDYDRDGA